MPRGKSAPAPRVLWLTESVTDPLPHMAVALDRIAVVSIQLDGQKENPRLIIQLLVNGQTVLNVTDETADRVAAALDAKFPGLLERWNSAQLIMAGARNALESLQAVQ